MSFLRPNSFVLAGIPFLATCGGSSGPDVDAPDVGLLRQKPGGGMFFVDDNEGGSASKPALSETLWARIVDIHDSDASGVRSRLPLMADTPVRPDVASDGIDFRLENDALGREILVILHTSGSAEFESALRSAVEDLPVLQPRLLASPTFPAVARNSAIVLHFDDLLAHGPTEQSSLRDDVRVQVGYQPQVAYDARIYFDPSHGAVIGETFHPTRIVVDLTISADELEAGGNPLAINVIGVPASDPATTLANLTLRLPTKEDFGSGQFSVLRNLRGRPLDAEKSGAFETGSATLDVVRALRSGNELDTSNGFLRDVVRPTLVGRFAATVTAAVPDAAPGSFVLEIDYQTACAKALEPGELLETGGSFLEVTQASAAPGPGGEIADVRARSLAAVPPAAAELLGAGFVLALLDRASGIDSGCWVEVVGHPGTGTEIGPEAQFRLRFSEPMDPRSVDPLETLRLYSGTQPTASTTVVGVTSSSPDATLFEFLPTLPLAHQLGNSEAYSLELVSGAAGVTDLAGNALDSGLPVLSFEVDSLAGSVSTGGVALRFESSNEYDENDPPGGTPDLRGTFIYDFTRGSLLPRPVQRFSSSLDGTSGVTSLMLPLPVGIRDPLPRLGSRLQTVWRYADAGWSVTDETKYDLDVEGLAWAPFGGFVSADFFERFEIRLGHSIQQPDELVVAGAVSFPNSGIFDAPKKFDQNVLEPAAARTVHARQFGYQIRPSDVFRNTTGTNMMPYPLQGDGNRGEPFTWRDTSLRGVGAFGGVGIPLGIERMIDPSIVPGSVAPAGRVPSFGLPLLVELRAYPSDTAIAVNDFQVAIATQVASLLPTFRVHSSGGTRSGTAVRVDPDLADVPSGGFDPLSTPPGQPTLSAFPAFYFGQLDTVTRLSRVHTVWFDALGANTDYVDPIVTPSTQPAGTSVRLEFRAALSFSGSNGAEFDASLIDPYGELTRGKALYPNDDPGWTSDIDDLDGRRFIQIRVTFANNVETGLSPRLDSLAFAFRRQD